MCFINKKKDRINLEQELTTIRNDAFCSYTLDRARRRLHKIKKCLTVEQYNKLWACIQNLDINNPDTYVPDWARKDHDYKRYMLYLRKELADYISGILKSYKAGEI